MPQRSSAAWAPKSPATINEELFSILKAPASRFGAYYTPISFSKAIEAAQMPNKNSIIARVREVMCDRG